MTKLGSQYQDLQKAFSRLKEAVVLPPTIIYQDATIQRFEFTLACQFPPLVETLLLNVKEYI